MIRSNTKELFFIGALTYTFLIPFHQKLATLAIILWVLLSIFNFKKFNTNKNWKWMLLPIFYFLYFIGSFTAETPNFGFLETKLSFLIFPILFFLQNYTTHQRTKMLRVFVLGLLVSGLLCFVFACYQSISIQEGSFFFRANVLEGRDFIEAILYGGNFFFGDHFSIFHQTVYYAFYLCSGIAILLFCPNIFSKRYRWILLLIFTLLIFLISNKASFIALAILLIFRLATMKISFFKKVVGLILVLGVVSVFIMTNPRAKDAVQKVIDGELVLDKNARYGFKTRILIWDAALTLIKEKPIWGYGFGETQLRLNEIYKEKEYQFVLKETYNAHNLWLQTWLENGLLGLLLLLAIFITVVQKAIKLQKYQNIVLALILIVLVNSLFESIFNRFSGVSFFCFLVCFIFSEPEEKIAGK